MGIFHWSPYFGYNSAEQEILFCVFLRFRNLPRLKLTWDFLGVNILPREAPGAQEVNEGGHEGQMSTSGTGLGPGHATQCRLRLGPPMSSIFVSWHPAWPKNVNIKTPFDDPETRWQRNTKRRNREAVPVKIGGGNAAEVAPGRFTTLSDVNFKLTFRIES
jgi:hypothetical protein